MKKNYNIPATNVVAFVEGSVIMLGSPNIVPSPNPGQTGGQNIDPGNGGNG
jgi:hypothetical protein